MYIYIHIFIYIYTIYTCLSVALHYPAGEVNSQSVVHEKTTRGMTDSELFDRTQSQV